MNFREEPCEVSQGLVKDSQGFSQAHKRKGTRWNLNERMN